jgi:iron(III) transport system permease protein
VIRWRLTLAVLLALLLGIPLAAPLTLLVDDPAAWQTWREASRLVALARNTLLLVAGTIPLALPLGIALAVLLYRTDLPGSRLWRLLTLLSLFVPLPLFTSGWQAALGSGGWLPIPSWSGSVWTPWSQGIGSAIWIHALAALPWLILLIGQGLTWVECEVEEDARTLLPAWLVLLRVTLPRAGAAIGAAALWVIVQVGTEITITDVMQVRTFAEEVYTQIVGGPDADEGIARAVAATLPFVLLVVLLVAGMALLWERRLPPRSLLLTPPLVYRLGRWRWPLTVGVGTLVAILYALPLASLVWRTGLVGAPPAWSMTATMRYLFRACQPPEGWMLVESLLLAAVAGGTTALLGLLVCWAMRGAAWFHVGIVILIAVAWAMPGPLVGLGLKTTISQLLGISDSPWLAFILYHGPSPVPLIWVDVIRFFPCAVALLWPFVRLLPAELHDAARVDGATPRQELLYVVWPLLAAAFGRSALAVAVLSLGEMSAGKLVATPGMPGYATEIFTQMHYGVTNELAARCVMLLIVVTLGGLGVAFWDRRRTRSSD